MLQTSVDVLMVGTGGQGVVVASDVLAEIGMNSGYDVKKSDSLGMAQRGGSVVSHVRWGRKVFSPMVRRGQADYLLAFEQLEAARWAPYLKPDGVATVADVVVVPVSTIGSTIPYPGREDVECILRRHTDQVFFLPASRICAELGNPRALNMVMLGFLSAFLDLDAGAWTNIIRPKLPAKFVESSLAAFQRGCAEARSMQSKIGG